MCIQMHTEFIVSRKLGASSEVRFTQVVSAQRDKKLALPVATVFL
jgi:hypothetical protein